MTHTPQTQDFLVVEGPDGTGKSTQIALLNDRLTGLGKTTEFYDFPSKGGNPLGDMIGDILTGKYQGTAPELISLPFALDRLMVTQERAKAGDRKDIVIADRYVLSNVAFHSAKIEDPVERARIAQLLEWIEYGVLSLPRPTFEVILVANNDFFQTGQHLDRTGATDRDYTIGREDVYETATDLQTAVNAFYLARTEGAATQIFNILHPDDSRKTAASLHAEIWAAIVPVLAGEPRAL